MIVIAVLFLFIIFSGLFPISEELFVVLASILWVEAASNLFKSAFDNELYYKVSLIREKLLLSLIVKHGSSSLFLKYQLKRVSVFKSVFLLNIRFSLYLVKFLFVRKYFSNFTANYFLKVAYANLFLVKLALAEHKNENKFLQKLIESTGVYSKHTTESVFLHKIW